MVVKLTTEQLPLVSLVVGVTPDPGAHPLFTQSWPNSGFEELACWWLFVYQAGGICLPAAASGFFCTHIQ